MLSDRQDVVRVSQPAAGLGEGVPKYSHREVDHPSVGIADEAVIAVPTDVEGERGLMIVVKRTEASVPIHPQA